MSDDRPDDEPTKTTAGAFAMLKGIASINGNWRLTQSEAQHLVAYIESQRAEVARLERISADQQRRHAILLEKYQALSAEVSTLSARLAGMTEALQRIADTTIEPHTCKDARMQAIARAALSPTEPT